MKTKKELVEHYKALLAEKAINLWSASSRLSDDAGISVDEATELLNPYKKESATLSFASRYMLEEEEEEPTEEAPTEEEPAEEDEEPAEEDEDVADVEEGEGDADAEAGEWQENYTKAIDVAKWADALSEHRDAKVVELAWKVETAIKGILGSIKGMEEII